MSIPKHEAPRIVRAHPGLTLTELGRHTRVPRVKLAQALQIAREHGTVITRPLPPGSHHACTYWPAEVK